MGDRTNPIKFGPEWLRNLGLRNSSRGANPLSRGGFVGRGGSSGRGGSGGGVNASGLAPAAVSQPDTSTAAPPAVAGPSTTPAPVAGPSSAVAGPSTSSSSSPPNTNAACVIPSRVLLAKLRYGREEMLALYDSNSTPPSELRHNETLFNNRSKSPVALNNTFEQDMSNGGRGSSQSGGVSGSTDRYSSGGRGPGRGFSHGPDRGRPRMPYVRQGTVAGRGWYQPRMTTFNSEEEAAAEGKPAPVRPWLPEPNVPEWASKMFRKRTSSTTTTNWRSSQSRDEGDEWRYGDNPRNARPNHEREWPNLERGQGWNGPRRQWHGGDSQNTDENLPEWAVGNASGAVAGTFDSSGAFHGYSNDDSNLPKTQDNVFALARSQTQGCLARAKTAEEGSEEWWASDKAKKLSPKKFDATEIKFKKLQNTGKPESFGKQSSSSTDELHEIPEKLQRSTPEPEENEEFKKQAFTKNSKNFDNQRPEHKDETGNFQSVMINSNNSLRQKHQNMVPVSGDGSRIDPTYMQVLQASKPIAQNESSVKQLTLEEKYLEDLMEDLSLGEEDQHKILQTSQNQMMTRVSPIMASSGIQTSMIQTGIDSQQSNLGLVTGQAPGFMQAPGFHYNSIQGGMQSPNLQSLQGLGSQSGGFQGIHGPSMQTISQVGVSMGNSIGNNPMGNNNSMGNNPMGNHSMGINSMGNNPIGNTVMMNHMGNNPMGNNPMINIPLNSNPMGNNMMGNNPVGNNPMGNNPMGNNAIGNNPMGMPLQRVSPNMLQSQGLMSGGGSQMQGFQNSNLPNLGNNSLFMRQNSNGMQVQPPDQGSGGMYPMHGMQQHYGTPIYGGMMPNQQPGNQHLQDQWYYEDPEKKIQGPFSSKDMFTWFKAGFFTPSLMVRRACDVMMKPLGSYGPIVPFAQMDMMPFPMASGYDSHGQGNMNPQLTGLDMMNMNSMSMSSMNMNSEPGINQLQYNNIGLVRNQSFTQPPPQQPMMDNMWMQNSQSHSAGDLMWMQQGNSRPAENPVNKLPVCFWDQNPTAITPTSMLPEEMAKEMKTEDQILAQLRASQGIQVPLPAEPPKPSETMATGAMGTVALANVPMANATPNLEELHKIMQNDTLPSRARFETNESQDAKQQGKVEKAKSESAQQEEAATQAASKPQVESKSAKQAKNEIEKAKTKEGSTKGKKKSKDDKKEESPDVRSKDEETKSEKKSKESSPAKSKKEEKLNKKELENEKKEWLKEGFTIVKGTEKVSKDSKKKTEDLKSVEEAERKKKDEDKQIALEDDRRRKQVEALRKQEQQQKQAAESVIKKAPWSAANQNQSATNKEGLTLAEIQRLEREKKLEQMREQQQMMQIIAQQQAVALAREHDMQVGLGWAKRLANNPSGLTLADIQAEARKQQAAAAAVASAQQVEEVQPSPPPVINNTPWGSSTNGGGFWDTKPAPKPAEPKPVDPPKQEQPKKKKPVVKKETSPVVKKETSPAVEFEAWCNMALTAWSSKIDVPTFVGFLKDIESPYEVKDYVKCYLGDTKDSNDFARNFLERRSKMLRVGTVTPSDDLCSPAVAVNPRTNSGTDYSEVKGKGKKTKKNKMQKVDARILGFSVTASEDRINVGDIDTV